MSVWHDKSPAVSAPTGSNTVLLFQMRNRQNERLPVVKCTQICLSIKHSHGGTLQLKRSTDGTNWTTVHEEALTVSGVEANRRALNVAPYEWFQVNWVNGGTTQNPWIVDVALTDEMAPEQPSA